MIRPLVYSLLTFFYLTMTYNIHAEEIEIKNDFSTLNISSKLMLLEDASNEYSIEQIIAMPKDQKWSKSREKVPNFGMTKSKYWLYVDLKNTTSDEVDLYIHYETSFTDFVEIYVLEDGRVKDFSSNIGDTVPFSEKKIKTITPLFEIKIPSQKVIRVVMAIRSTGSLSAPFSLITPNALLYKITIDTASHMVFWGFLLAMAIYNLFIFLSYRDWNYLIYVGGVLAALTNLSVQKGDAFLFLWPENPAWANKALPFTGALYGFFVVFFAQQFLEVNKRKPQLNKFLKILIAASLAVAILSLFLPYSIALPTTLLLGLLMCASALFAGIVIMNQGYQPARYYVFAWIFMVMGVFISLMPKLGLMPVNWFTDYGWIIGSSIEIYLFSFALGARMNMIRSERRKFEQEALSATRKLNEELGLLVNQRTQDIRYLLDHIPQGVCTIDGEGKIGSEFSRQFPLILENPEVAKKSLKELLISKASIFEDEKDQIWQSLLLCEIGSNPLNFELNAEKFPKEMEITNSTGKVKHLRLTWNYDTDSEGQISKILITIMDISVEKKLQKEAQRHNLEMNIVRELASLDEKTSFNFIFSTIRYLEQIRALQSSPVINADQMVRLFVFLHTLKGNTRTLNLLNLAEAIHNAEDYLNQVIKKNDLNTINQGILNEKIEPLFALFNQYAIINKNMLNRKSPDAVKIELTTEEARDLIESIGHTQNLSQDESKIIQRFIQSLKERISCNVNEAEILEMVKDWQKEGNLIAASIKKPTPIVAYHGEPIRIPQSLAVTLQDCMIHLLRNSLDHGLEDAAERASLGKAPNGQISINAILDRDILNVKIQDDGRGLAIGKLRNKFKGGATDASPNEIAQLIFQSGVTTADSVTSISGRGIGMNAVRAFVKEKGGEFKIEIGEPKDLHGNFYDFCFVLTLPLTQFLEHEFEDAS